MIRHLLALRYKLLWAQSRNRSGKVAIFMVLYLAGAGIAALAGTGGWKAARTGIEMGRAEFVAALLLTGCASLALAATLILGIGVNPAFSVSTLQRYPLTPSQRLAARHALGIFDPIWLIALALFGGVLAAFQQFGQADLSTAVPALLLLWLITYLAARVLAVGIDWLLQHRWGPLVLMALMLLLSFSPAILTATPALREGLATVIRDVARWTPSRAAAAAMVKDRTSSLLLSFALLAGWVLLLLPVLAWVDRLKKPARSRAVQVGWDSFYDRVAGWAGPHLAPLVAKNLRYLFRSVHFRFSYPFAIPLVAVFAFNHSRSGRGAETFLMALAAVSMLGAISLGAWPLNLFGFDGPGLRRYFLLPTRPEHVLRAATLPPLILSGILIPLAIGVYVAFAPARTDARVVVVLVSAGIGGLLLYHSAGMWVSILAPSRMPLTMTFGNRLSLPANAVMIACLAVFFGLPIYLRKIDIERLLGLWFLWAAYPVLGAALYLFTWKAGARALAARAEKLISGMDQPA